MPPKAPRTPPSPLRSATARRAAESTRRSAATPEEGALALLQSAERCLGLRLCYHDYLRVFRLPYAYRVHESAACLRQKETGGQVCHSFCGADGDVDRQIRRHPDGWLHRCPHGMTKIAVAVTYGGGLAGVLFAECELRRDGLLKQHSAAISSANDADMVRRSQQELADRQRMLCAVARELGALIQGNQGEDATDDRRGVIQRYIEGLLRGEADGAGAGMDDETGLEGLGRALALSASRAGHLVREIFRRSYRDLLQEARANRAALLLSGTELSLSEIALRLGFADQSHFTRAFRRHFRQTPAAYRRSFLEHH